MRLNSLLVMLSIISHTTAYAGEVGNSWGILQFDFSNLRNLTPISQGGGSYYYSADFPLPGEDVGIYAKALPEKWGTSQTLWVVVPGATNAPDDFKDVKCNFIPVLFEKSVYFTSVTCG